MQTNLHLDLPNDDTPSKALRIAFEKGVTDIIAFDYFSPDLEKAKSHARTAAMKSAKEKAEMLLSVFETRPPAINVQEQTVVRKPDALYESFTNAVGGEMANGWRDHNLPSFSAPRPKNTYYKGFQSTEDIVGGGLPMEMEISVVSSVRIYYESPAAAKREKKEEGKK